MAIPTLADNQALFYPSCIASPEGAHGIKGGKHFRWVHCPDNDNLYNFGGDWNETVGLSSGVQTVWMYDVRQDNGTGDGSGWTEVFPFCGPPGTAYPGGPDQVTAVWDSTRHLFWILPGYIPGQNLNLTTEQQLSVPLAENGSETEITIVGDQGGGIHSYVAAGYTNKALCIINDDFTFEWIRYTGIDEAANTFTGCTRGFGGTPKGAHAVGEWVSITGTPPCGLATVRAAIQWTGFSFDPTINRYQIRSKMRTMPVGEGSANGFYDAVSDKIIRITGNGNARVTRFTLPGLTFDTTDYTGLGLNSVPIGNNDIAYDPVGRVAWVIQPGTVTSMLKYDVAAHTLVKITGSGVPPRNTTPFDSDGTNCMYPKWDNFNRKVIWPYVQSFSSGGETNTFGSSFDLWVYDPDTNTWDHTSPAPAVDPTFVNTRAGNGFVFHPTFNFMFGIGKSFSPRLWFYRYKNVTTEGIPSSITATVV